MRFVVAAATALALITGYLLFFRSTENSLNLNREPLTVVQEVNDVELRTERIDSIEQEILRQSDETYPPVNSFIALLEGNSKQFESELQRVERLWHPGNSALLVEILRFSSNRNRIAAINRLLAKTSGNTKAKRPNEWYPSFWAMPYTPHPDYGEFKSLLYDDIDQSFADYFASDRQSTIRLDEVLWGGVRRDGIPPLKNPEVLPAAAADYLKDTDVVFGVVVNGEARAYPKRILAWHEMVKDQVGGESINGVYCTLCGSMIVYFTEDNEGHHYELGTSGFLYRSNKLMYDHQTRSLWSTIKGEPVIGPLVGKGIKLKSHFVVTTSWGEWKKLHPETEVLSLRTGHRRDYGEGVAYKKYFSTDQLMFGVPKLDNRLANKAEVLILRDQTLNTKPVAVAVDYLKTNPLLTLELDGTRALIVTDTSGANRAFEIGDQSFQFGDSPFRLLDDQGRQWSVREHALTSDEGNELTRMPSHRAFWFGWHAAHPNTELIRQTPTD